MLKGSKKFEWAAKCEQAFLALKEHLGRPPLLLKPLEVEKLYLYLAVSKEAVTAALVREKESTVASLLREQKALGCRGQVSRVREISSGPHGRIQKTEALLSCTPD